MEARAQVGFESVNNISRVPRNDQIVYIDRYLNYLLIFFKCEQRVVGIVLLETIETCFTRSI